MVMEEVVQGHGLETTDDPSATPILAKKLILEKPDPVDKDEFNHWLLNKVSRQSTMISRIHGEKIIQYLRYLREKGNSAQEVKANFSASFRFQVKKRKFELIRVGGLGDILCMPIQDKKKIATHAMLGQHRQVIFKEDMFDVIDSAHRHGEKHRGYKGTFKKISATYCNIPREVVHKYVSMCVYCQKMHACYIPAKGSTSKPKKTAPPPPVKKKEIEMAFLSRCQIDIMDMTDAPDVEGNFSYIGHFLDHHSKYNVLFPLKKDDAFYVAKKLCRYVFSHFGLPRILHSNMGRKYVDEIITWVLQLWSADAHILNGSPQVKRINSLIQQRQKTIVVLIETIRSRQSDSSCNWSAWLPGIQYSLNTNQFDPATPPAYDTVFNRRPVVSTYKLPAGEIPREEDYHIVSSLLTEPEPPPQEMVTNSILISNPGSHDADNTSSDQNELANHTEVKEDVENLARTDMLNCSQFSPVSITLGEQQYAITKSILQPNSDVVALPYVSAGAENNNSLVTLSNIGDYSEERCKVASDMLYYTNPVQQFTSSLDIGAVENEDHEHFAAHNGDQDQFGDHNGDQDQFVENNGDQDQFVENNGDQDQFVDHDGDQKHLVNHNGDQGHLVNHSAATEQHTNCNGNLSDFLSHNSGDCQLLNANSNHEQTTIQNQTYGHVNNGLSLSNVIIHHPQSFQLTTGDSSDDSNITLDSDNVMTSMHLNSNIEEQLANSSNNPSSMDLDTKNGQSRADNMAHLTLQNNTIDMAEGSLCTSTVNGVSVHLMSSSQEMNDDMKMEEVDVTGSGLGLTGHDGCASSIQMTDSLACGGVQLNDIPLRDNKVEVGVVNRLLSNIPFNNVHDNSFVEDSENTDFENDESDDREDEEYDIRL